MEQNCLRWAGFHGFFAVAMGAFGAHGLKAKVQTMPPEDALKALDWVATGAHYQLAHAGALLALAALWPRLKGVSARRSLNAWAWGTLIFSGTLYAMALGAPRWLGAVTPVGGMALLLGWASLFTALKD